MGGTGPDYDLFVIGAGHKALIAAAYAAAAGYRVCVVERRRSVGGAVSTAEIVPGYRFDLGGSAHILIRLTPIVEELELEAHGLEYLEVDPLFLAPFEDGHALFFHRDVARTVAGFEERFPGEGEAYVRFLDRWRPFAPTVRDAFPAAPTFEEIAWDPPIVAMTFSAIDDTLAPPGHEVLWLWAQYYPYELASGRNAARVVLKDLDRRKV